MILAYATGPSLALAAAILVLSVLGIALSWSRGL